MKKLIGLFLMIFLAVALIFSPNGIITAGEHPAEHPKEHPSEKAKEHPAEHPKEHPAEHPAKKVEFNLESVAVAITAHVEEESKKHGGLFQVKDTVDKKTLKLKLDKVHRERLSQLSDGRYFVCADFKNDDGVMYDLDFFMIEGSGGGEVTETMVHKKAGTPRYGWFEKDGVWIRK